MGRRTVSLGQLDCGTIDIAAAILTPLAPPPAPSEPRDAGRPSEPTVEAPCADRLRRAPLDRMPLGLLVVDAAGRVLAKADVGLLPQPACNEIEVGLAVLDGRADAGLAIRAVARQLRLDFVPLHRERYDLVVRRRDYFEEPFQSLLAFARSPAAAAKAADLEGYEIAALGAVRYNGP